MRPRAARYDIAIAGITLALAATAPAAAADPEHGKELVAQWCEECHAAESTRQASDVAPPFVQFANDPAYTDDRLRGWLHDPHPPMPKFELDRRTIDDIVAYIRTLTKK